MEPLSFEFALNEFDLGLLPVASELLESDETLLREAIREYLSGVFGRLGGKARISAYDDRVQVEWSPVSVAANYQEAMELAIDLLRQGAYGVAETLLRELERRWPEDGDVLLNYGMMLSDQGRLDEAIVRLKKVAQLDPDSANAWVALGVAFARQGNNSEAAVVLAKAVQVDPENGYALRNLGGVLAKEKPELALPHLKRAAELLPDDQQALYGYGLCLMQTGKLSEADVVFQRAIEINSFSDVAEACRGARTQLAHRSMRAGVGAGPQMDVVMYCLAALQAFEKMGNTGMQQTTAEIALLGRNGLDINDPAKKYKLRTMAGEFSGRQLLAYMYVGLRKMAPEMDPGVDFSKELEAAQSLFGQGAKNGPGDE